MTREPERRWDIVVVGGASMDYTARGPRLPTPGCSVPGDEFLASPGGKGVNQAVAAARLGARVALVARVGRDEQGRAIRAYLSAEGVDITHVSTAPDRPTGVTLIQVDGTGMNQTMGFRGATRLLTRELVLESEPLGTAPVVLLQIEPPIETITAAALVAHGRGATVVLDAAPPQEIPEALLRATTVLRANSQEVEALTGVRVRTVEAARTAAARIRELGPAAAVVAAGTGDLVVWDGGERWLPHFAVHRRDVTGAGDAFTAALAVALAEGRSLGDAGPLASAAAALTTTALGVRDALPGRRAVLDLLEASERGVRPCAETRRRM